MQNDISMKRGSQLFLGNVRSKTADKNEFNTDPHTTFI